MSEAEQNIKIAQFLSSWFYVEMEVWSIDKTNRIDMILYHHSDYLGEYPIGIEAKLNTKKQGKDVAKWLKQSVRYTKSEFVTSKTLTPSRVLVCTYPQVSGSVFEEGELMSKHDVKKQDCFAHHHNVNSFLGQFGIGELQRYRDWQKKETLRIVYNAKLIWDQREDLFKPENYILYDRDPI